VLIGWDLETRKQVIKHDLSQHMKSKEKEGSVPLSLAVYAFGEERIVLVQLKTGRIIKYGVETSQLMLRSEHRCGSATYFRISSPLAFGQRQLMLVPSLLRPSMLDLVDVVNWDVIVAGIGPDGADPGMCLCAKFLKTGDNQLILAAGYDNGTVSVFKSDDALASFSASKTLQLFPQTILDLSLRLTPTADLKLTACGAGKQLKMVLLTFGFHDVYAVEQTLSEAGLGSLDLDGDGLVIATGGWDARLRFFSAKSLVQLGTQSLHLDTVNAVRFFRFAPRGLQGPARPGQRFPQLLVAASKDTTISLWDVQAE
jgi:hypothetical protein